MAGDIDMVMKMRGEGGIKKLHEMAAKYFAGAEIMVEVGSWAGESSEVWSQYVKTLYCVDSWDIDLPPERYGHTMHDVRMAFYERMSGVKNARIIQAESAMAARMFDNASLDVVYIDAQHTYKHVSRDMAIWLPKVKSGGVASGHDYNEEKFPGVVQAVNERFGVPITFGGETSWLAIIA